MGHGGCPDTRHLKGPSCPSSHDHGGPATQGRWHHTDGGDPAWWSPEAGMALPHLHLHTQAVEEMSREGQAVHGRECGINPAWGRQMWLALRGVLTPGSRWLPGLPGPAASAHLIPMEGPLAWPRVLSGWALQEGDCPSWPSLLNPALNSTDGETQAWERSGRAQTTQGQATHHSRSLYGGAGDDVGLPPLLGELGFSLHHPQRRSLGQTWGKN